jgi:L-alanine-DL-glutamate epimerase-like enolase superfamily enzyme
VHGINIKLMKCGGLAEALRMAEFARAEGWVVMLGCMIESSVGIAAAAHVASLAGELDLDAEALITNNPAGPPVLSPEGLLATPAGPGLGATLSA